MSRAIAVSNKESFIFEVTLEDRSPSSWLHGSATGASCHSSTPVSLLQGQIGFVLVSLIEVEFRFLFLVWFVKRPVHELPYCNIVLESLCDPVLSFLFHIPTAITIYSTTVLDDFGSTRMSPCCDFIISGNGEYSKRRPGRRGRAG